MRKNLLTIGIMLLLGATVLPTTAQVVNNDNEDGVVKLNANLSKYETVPGQVLVKFKDTDRVEVNASRGQFRSTSVSRLTQVLQKYGTEEMEQLLPNKNPKRTMRKARAYNGETIVERDLSQLYRLKLSDEHAMEVPQLVKDLESLDEVEFAEPNYILHTLGTICDDYSDNPSYSDQWYLSAYGVTELWNKPIINSERPVIAIIDTGVDMTHPDLVDNLWTNPGEVNGEKGYDNDGNGFNNDLHGWDFINNTPKVKDFNMHGTHVAGIAAASNNGIGIIGANPLALIMPVTVMQSDGSGDVGTIIQGINYAVANGATVLNLSLGTYANSNALRLALEQAYQTAVIVAAAGNDRCSINQIPPGPMYPAAYSFVLGVQATNSNGTLAAFSNYDPDGPNYTNEKYIGLWNPDGYNYELKSPGTNIFSTIPGGKYKALNGTSMAAPLVAGAISALTMVKDYSKDDGVHQEILWGDLTHTNNIAEAYALGNRPAELDLLRLQFQNRKDLDDETEEDYSGDHEIDAGEIVSIYPVIRTTFGEASNIKMHLEMGDEFEDPSTVEIYSDSEHKVDFGWHLDAYGRNVSLNPLEFKVANNVADNRHIKLKIVAVCDESDQIYELPFTIIATNMVKINGMITEDLTLTADHVYYVNGDLGIDEGVTLTIEPGTRLEFARNTKLSSFGKLKAKGTPEKPIVFTKHIGETEGWEGIASHSSNTNPLDTISYCKIEGFCSQSTSTTYPPPYMEDCVVIPSQPFYGSLFYQVKGKRNTYPGCVLNGGGQYIGVQYSNIVNIYFGSISSVVYSNLPKYSSVAYNNYINCYSDYGRGGLYQGREYWLQNYRESPGVDITEKPSYFGTSREDIVRGYLYEMGNAPSTYGTIDLSDMRTTPVPEAHGIVWKVVVNGKDAQDEYEELAPLGVGKHKFEVYFNRPMNKNVAPNITFGLRDPYTQNAVNEDGSWNEDGTIYTAYKTITGKTKSDGVNRIYVNGAEDNEYFEIPYEKTRFNINVQAVGSMATGFMANPGMGKVDLTLDHTNNNFDDAMGFNIYRYCEDIKKTIPAHYDENYHWIEETEVIDTIRINQEILDITTESYPDYDVIPGKTYCYYYKVLSTDLQEYDVSNVVAATPLTTIMGDANGSGNVSVADVISTVDYVLGENPKPFIFEAADLNTDNNVDVLDVIGIIQIILNQPSSSRAEFENVAEAVYTVENGMLYIETPITLSGLQIQVSTNEQPMTTNEMKGFEMASSWLTESDYRMLAYSFGSKTLAPGKHAIITIGDADITSLRLADVNGNYVLAVPGETTAVKDAMGSKVMLTKGVYNLSGQKVAGKDSSKLRKGVYIIDGQKMVK